MDRVIRNFSSNECLSAVRVRECSLREKLRRAVIESETRGGTSALLESKVRARET
jgi:hypothetical protein